jgi:hypothetical protein
VQYNAFSQKTFHKLSEKSLTAHTFGHWDWELKVSNSGTPKWELFAYPESVNLPAIQ